jgi:anti-anti-sigma regulatory factor
MSTTMTIQAHIAYELIENTDHQVVIVEFLSHDIATSAHARELGEQLRSLLRPQPRQYFVIDCTGVRSLGSTAFGEIVSFVHQTKAVWVCNLDNQLRFGAALIGLDNPAGNFR